MPKLISRKTARRKLTNSKPVSMKLTDLERLILSGASKRGDGAATLPSRTSEKKAQKLMAVLVEKGLAREVGAKTHTPVWRHNEDGRASALIITKLGRNTVGIEDGGRENAGDAAFAASTPPSIPVAKSSDSASASPPNQNLPRQGSKLAEVIALMGRKQGAGIEDLTSRTGWLPHTTRAALTGLRKRGFAIERSRSEQGGSVYRIAVGAAPVLAA